MAYGPKRTPEVVAELITRIQQHRIMGYKAADSCKLLSIPNRTYWNYVKMGRKDFLQNELTQRDQIIRDFYEARKEEIKIANLELEKAPSSGDKARWMEILKGLEDSLMAKLIEMGYLPKARENPQIAIQTVGQTNVLLEAWKDVVYGEIKPIPSRSKDNLPGADKVL